jgi:hypothetical protein
MDPFAAWLRAHGSTYLASAGHFAQPYGLANLSFQFDAPLMATAVLLAWAAARQGLRWPGLHWRAVC